MNEPRLVLITNGLRPVSTWFHQLNSTRVGVVCWDSASSDSLVERLYKLPLLPDVYSGLRKRRYASLLHYCRVHNFQYARISKNSPEELERTLNRWTADLVITSGCPFVPLKALKSVTFGGINIHPSLLPAYRGADPVSWQVIDQVNNTGVTVHGLSDDYDCGPILAQSELARQKGVSRDALMNQLEGALAHELVSQVVDRLKRCGDLSWGQAQHTRSNTANASRLSLSRVGQSRPLNDLSVDAVWDIVNYFRQCPPEWLSLTGWRGRCTWRPMRLEQNNSTLEDGCDSWQISSAGRQIYMQNGNRIIVLKGEFGIDSLHW